VRGRIAMDEMLSVRIAVGPAARNLDTSAPVLPDAKTVADGRNGLQAVPGWDGLKTVPSDCGSYRLRELKTVFYRSPGPPGSSSLVKNSRQSAVALRDAVQVRVTADEDRAA
jgi:hypothetical protein